MAMLETVFVMLMMSAIDWELESGPSETDETSVGPEDLQSYFQSLMKISKD